MKIQTKKTQKKHKSSQDETIKDKKVNTKKPEIKIKKEPNVVVKTESVAPDTNGQGVKNKKKRKAKNNELASPNKPKMPKFEGTAAINKSEATPKKEHVKQEQKTTSDKLNKRQIKRMKAKMKKQSMQKQTEALKEKILQGDSSSLVSVAEKIEKLESTVVKSKSTLRRLSQLKKIQKVTLKEAPRTGPEKKPQELSKKQAKKEARKAKRAAAADKIQSDSKPQKKHNKQHVKVEKEIIVAKNDVDSNDDKSEATSESDYDVESTVKVDKITKKMNSLDSEEEEEASANENDVDSDVAEEAEEDENDNESGESDESLEEDKVAQEVEKIVKTINKKNNVKPKPVKKELDIKDIVPKGQSRYVVFVGNLPYDAEKEAIKEHFSKVGEIKDVRIPTEKGGKKPRGFAYVELSNEEEYQKAFSLHHSVFNGRRINVLYTQGGKKKGEDKKSEIKAKNFKLKAMRDQGKLAGSVKHSNKRSVRRTKKKQFEGKSKDE